MFYIPFSDYKCSCIKSSLIQNEPAVVKKKKKKLGKIKCRNIYTTLSDFSTRFCFIYNSIVNFEICFLRNTSKSVFIKELLILVAIIKENEI